MRRFRESASSTSGGIPCPQSLAPGGVHAIIYDVHSKTRLRHEVKGYRGHRRWGRKRLMTALSFGTNAHSGARPQRVSSLFRSRRSFQSLVGDFVAQDLLVNDHLNHCLTL